MAKRAARNKAGFYVTPEQKTKRRSDCRKWRIMVKHTVNGQEKWKGTIFHGTWTAANEKGEELAILAQAEDRAVKVFPNGIETTVTELMIKQNDTKLELGAIAESTYDKRRHMGNAVSLIIGNMKVVDVGPADIEKVFLEVQQGNTPSGKAWKSSSISTLSATMHDAFKFALLNQLINHNPVDAANKPKVVRVKRYGLHIDEEAKLMDALNPLDYHEVVIGVMMEAGLRIGEAGGLRWTDIRDGYIHVDRQLKNDGTYDLPKNDKTRKVPLSARLKEFLDQIPHHSANVVSSPLKAPLRPNAAQEWWRRHREAWGYPDMYLHEIGRHTFATNLAEAGVHPKMMQELLGHASIKTSLEIYTHVHGDDLKDAMKLKDERAARSRNR